MQAILTAAVLACLTFSPVIAHQASPATETPTQFYLRYRATVPTATSIDQVVAFWSLAQRQEFNGAPASERPSLAEVRAFFQGVSDIKVVKQTPTEASASQATLQVEAVMNGRPVKATVMLQREADGWKVASGPEGWQ